MANATFKENCARILQLAENLYAAHISHQQIMNFIGVESVRRHLVSVIDQSEKEIILLGGKVETRKDSLDISCPLITNVDGELIDYHIGRIGSEKFLNNLR